MREIPFSFIQYPLWEYFKVRFLLATRLLTCLSCDGSIKATWTSVQGSRVEPWQGAVCGALAGGIAAATTTPLDVAKTRVMLAKVGLPSSGGGPCSGFLPSSTQAGDSEVQTSTVQLLANIWRREGLAG